MKKKLQTINNITGHPEYVLVPVNIFFELRELIEKKIQEQEEYTTFKPEDYVKNPVALARLKAGMTQAELAERLKVSQAYISKIEKEDYNVTATLLEKTINALHDEN